MRTLKNHVIVYDKECPMCNLYTGAFIKAEMLDKAGREPYGACSAQVENLIDKKRACNEIALVDTSTNTVTYGIESIFKVLAHSFPMLKTLFDNRYFRWLMSRLYSLISYNRKAIIPGNSFEGTNACTPDLNVKYRWIYIIISWVFTSVVLNRFVNLLHPLVPASSFMREFFICGGQILFQYLIAGFVNKERRIHYLGNMMTVSLAGALLLLPALFLSLAGIFTDPLVYLFWFLLTVGVMLAEHYRRCSILEMNWILSLTWIIYRCLVLLFIYNF